MKKGYMHKTMAPVVIAITMLFITGCATTEQTQQMEGTLSSLNSEFRMFKDKTEMALANLSREDDSIRKQLLGLSIQNDNREEKLKNILGKLDELDYQLRAYWKETKAEIGTIKKPGDATNKPFFLEETGKEEPKYDETYKEGFEAFQKGMFDESIKKFNQFIDSNPNTPLVSNAYYWIGESYMNLKNYEKAILSFQEIIDKYPKSEKAPRAFLAQADAFLNAKDKKSSITILKRVIELYPKSEEALMAERRLRSLGGR